VAAQALGLTAERQKSMRMREEAHVREEALVLAAVTPADGEGDEGGRNRYCVTGHSQDKND
jgi:hypothetical protein